MLHSSTFGDYEPFHLVLLLNATDGEIHRLVRASEPPIHDRVDIKRLQDGDQQKLRMAFKQIQEQLKEVLTKIDAESVEMEEILTLPIDGSDSGGKPGIHAGEWKPFDRRSRASSGTRNIEVGTTKIKGKRKKKAKKKKGLGGGTQTVKKTGNAIPFEAIPVPLNSRKYEIEIYPLENLEIGEIRFMVDQNMDETCLKMNSEPYIVMKKPKIDGKSIPKKQLKYNKDGEIYAILAFNLSIEKAVNLKFDFVLPEELRLDKEKHVGLKAEIIRRREIN